MGSGGRLAQAQGFGKHQVFQGYMGANRCFALGISKIMGLVAEGTQAHAKNVGLP